MATEESYRKELILQRKLNDELLRACRRHAINNRHQGWLALSALFGCISPIVALLYYAIEHGGTAGYPWLKAAAIIALVALFSVVGNRLLARGQKSANQEIRRTCREAQQLGFFIVKRSSQYQQVASMQSRIQRPTSSHFPTMP